MRHLRRNMGRRRKNDDWVGLAAQFGGFIILLSLISPQVRQAISAIGFIAICLSGIATASLVGFGVYRFATRSQRTNTLDQNVDLKTLNSDTDCRGPEIAPDLIGQLRSIDWFQFEKVIAQLYRKLGYTVTRRGGAKPDGGIDLVIEKDGRRSAVQCKQWKSWNVGVKAVREFLGALTDAQISKGIFVTLCGYTGEAKQLADKHGIEIVNETGLAEMIEATEAQLDPEIAAIFRDTRKFCPKCESKMVLRTATKGIGVGSQFWGCSTFPKCRFTMPL